MTSEERIECVIQLMEMAEAIELHHERRDRDWLRPEELRRVLRLMYFLLSDYSGPSRGSDD